MLEMNAEPAGRQKPRLVYVVHSLDPGGTERLATDMAIAFAKEYDVRVVCLDRPGLWASLLRLQKIPVQCLYRQDGFDPSVPFQLARWFRLWRADIVHAHQCTPWFYAALARLLYRAPRLVLEEHGRFHPERRRPLRIAIHGHVIRRLTDAFVAVSLDIRRRLVRYEGLRENDIRIIYNGVAPVTDLDVSTRAALRKDLGATDGDLLVTTVGRLDPIKNLPMLVRALEDAARTIPRLRAAIVGDGPEWSRVQDAIAEARLADRVRMTGFRADARLIAQVSDLFVLTSFSEGTSMALLEAMSAGVPVAVTAVGGNPEIVRDSENGWLVPSDDSSALASVIRTVQATPQNAEHYGNAGRSDFEARYSFDAMIAQYRALYLELLRGQASALSLPHTAPR